MPGTKLKDIDRGQPRRRAGSRRRRARHPLVAATLAVALLAMAILATGSVGPGTGLASDAECEVLNEQHCLLPYPSSFFLATDATTATGLRVALPKAAMPRNILSIPIDPTPYSSLDGFSPGSPLITAFPGGVDLDASHVATIDTPQRSLDPDSPTVLVDVTSGERVVHFAELDSHATRPERQAFLIRPAVRLHEGHRYIVAIRSLIDPHGTPVPPTRAFASLRDRTTSPLQAVEGRRAGFEQIFAELDGYGIDRSSLVLAWDFTVASTRSLTGRMLAVRDRGLAINGDGAPPFEVTSVDENPGGGLWRRVRGSFVAPSFLREDGGGKLRIGPDGLPAAAGTLRVPFVVHIPRAALRRPARASVYGHGLLEDRNEIEEDYLQQFASEANFVFASTNWTGMAKDDLLQMVLALPDLSRFAAIPDRLQQAALHFILLGRLLVAADGFATSPAFQHDGAPVIDRRHLYFYGNSQGAVLGAFYLAVSPDTTRGVLGVGASNFSFLLERSLGFAPLSTVVDLFYRDELDRVLVYPLLQQLWDRAEGQGYQSHLLADPLPGTPVKKVLLQVGWNDALVSHRAAEIQARSLGLWMPRPSVHPVYGVRDVVAPFDGSAFVPYDLGAADVPATNRFPEVDNGVHEAVRRLPAAQAQIDAFLRPDGKVVNFCPGPCVFADVPGVIAAGGTGR